MAMVQCPTSYDEGLDGRPLIGCGAMIPDVRDDEGLVDCPKCGMWFNPEAEK